MSLSPSSSNLFEIVLKIAHYTGFDRDEIVSWTVDEIQLAIRFIEKETQEKAIIALAIVDYQILLSRQYDQKQASQATQAQKHAEKIKTILTGIKPKKTSNLAFFQAMGVYRDKTTADFTNLK